MAGRPSSAATRRTTERWGRMAETLAALRLRGVGWRILARRARTPFGEIDIVARRGRVVAAVEVKARAGAGAAARALGPRQRLRLQRAAHWLMPRLPGASGCDLRFDLILIRPWRLPHHVADAWRVDDPL